MFPKLNSPNQLVCFVDAAHDNCLCNRRSATSYVFTICGGEMLYCIKAQSITATNSTEAEFFAAAFAAKQAKFLRAILNELGHVQQLPSPNYEDKVSAIKIINAKAAPRTSTAYRYPTLCYLW